MMGDQNMVATTIQPSNLNKRLGRTQGTKVTPKKLVSMERWIVHIKWWIMNVLTDAKSKINFLLGEIMLYK